MPAPNEFAWYKWFPVKAMTSLRFASLSLAEEGFYRRLYDLASLAQPSDKRGWVYEHDRPASVTEIAHMLRVRCTVAARMLHRFTEVGLVARDARGAWGFPNFAKHQRDSHLRQREEGLGSAEIRNSADDLRHKIGATDADADADADAEGGPAPARVQDSLANDAPNDAGSDALPPERGGACEEASLRMLVALFISKTKSCDPIKGIYERFRLALQHFGEAALQKAILENAVPGARPWTVTDALAPSPPPPKRAKRPRPER